MPKQALNIARHLVQVLVLALFIAPTVAAAATDKVPGEGAFFGTLASSSFGQSLSLSDPLAALQTIAAAHALPQPALLLSAGAVLAFYALLGGRAFCGWVCPVNLLLEIVAFLTKPLHKALNVLYVNENNRLAASSHALTFLDATSTLVQPTVVADNSDNSNVSGLFANLNRRTKIGVMLAVLIVSALMGIPVFEAISPVNALFRALTLGAATGLWLLLAILLAEVFFPGRAWCRKMCPLGGLYQLLGRAGIFSVVSSGNCIGCNACKKICLANPEILNPVIADKAAKVKSADCLICGKCQAVCPVDTLRIKPGIPFADCFRK